MTVETQPKRIDTNVGVQNFIKAGEQTRDVLKAYLATKNRLGADKITWNREYATRTIARGKAEQNAELGALGNEINTLLDKLAKMK